MLALFLVLTVVSLAASCSSITTGSRISLVSTPPGCWVVTDCLFRSLSGAMDGGAFDLSAFDLSCSGSHSVSFHACTFINCSSERYGGAVYVQFAQLAMNLSCASECQAVSVGQFAEVSESCGTSPSLSDCNIRSCSPSALTGGTDGVYFTGATSMTFVITRTNFSNGHSNGPGAMIGIARNAASNFAFSLSFSTAEGCIGDSVISVSGGRAPTLSFCNFIRNNATGAVLVSVSFVGTIPVSDCVFLDNAGNRIFATGNGAFTVSNCVFSASPTVQPGSAENTFIDPSIEPLPVGEFPLHGCLGLTPAPSSSRRPIECAEVGGSTRHSAITNGCVNVSNVLFEDLASPGTQWGGAIYLARYEGQDRLCTHDYYAVLSHCSFVRCTSTQYGGALGFSQVGIEIGRSCGESCSASLGGHFMYAVQPCNLHSLDQTTISACAPSQSAGTTGAIELQAPPIFAMSSVNFSRCYGAERGAAFSTDWYNDATFGLLDMQFEWCNGPSIIWIASDGVQNIEHSNFIKNNAATQGLIAAHTDHQHIVVGDVAVRGCVFDGNTGATFWSNGLGFSIFNCVFSGTIGGVTYSGANNVENSHTDPLSLPLWAAQSCPVAEPTTPASPRATIRPTSTQTVGPTATGSAAASTPLGTIAATEDTQTPYDETPTSAAALASRTESEATASPDQALVSLLDTAPTLVIPTKSKVAATSSQALAVPTESEVATSSEDVFPSPTTSIAPDPAQQDLRTGAVVGIGALVGIIAAGVVIAVAVIILLVLRSRKRGSPPSSPSGGLDAPMLTQVSDTWTPETQMTFEQLNPVADSVIFEPEIESDDEDDA